MTIRAIFSHCGLPFWVDVAKYLHDHFDWEICYFIGSKTVQEKARRLFPGTIFHSNHLANRNLFPDMSKPISLASLDKDILIALSPYESIFMKMMDRHDYDGSFTYRKRLSCFHQQLMYWKGVLDHYRPDVVVFRTAPHMGYDYILYALSRCLGIRTIMFERTTLPGILFPVETFEEGSKKILQAYQSAINKKIHHRPPQF